MFEIHTPRLRVRPWRDGDRAAFRQMVEDAEMMRYVTGDKVWSEADIDGFFARQQAQLERNGACMGALCRKAESDVVGVAGAQRLDRLDAWDIGWWVWRDHWGKGFAREVAGQLVRHVLDGLRQAEVWAVIDPDNIASIRVAESAGMERAGETTADLTASWRPPTPVLLFRATK